MKKYILKITLCIALFFTPLFISSLKAKDVSNNDLNQETPDFFTELGNNSNEIAEIGAKEDDCNTKEKAITMDEKCTTDNIVENENKKQEISNTDTQDNVSSKQISINSFLKNIDYKKVALKPKETLSVIARQYTMTCNPNTTLNLIKLLNNLTDVDNLDEGTVLLIPHKTLQNGSLYKVKRGNTWHNIWETRYPEYDRDQLIRFLITINALPNDDLPVDENIFLPKL